ncbi:MAG: T9SS type A sorting domain-containing protein [Saprospiraceae bacterium]|nr:T9SS type A sorting domain-containing protein [Candidatus Parvibacillus calidus]
MNSVLLYPNPFFNSDLTIEFVETPTSLMKIELFDLEGNSLQVWNTSVIKVQLSIGELQSGSYILRISDGENYILRKIVKI